MASATTREGLASAYANLATHASVHSADPGTGSASMVSSKLPITYASDTVSDGIRVGTIQVTVPANVTITHGATWAGTGTSVNVDSGALSAPYTGPGDFILTVRVAVS